MCEGIPLGEQIKAVIIVASTIVFTKRSCSSAQVAESGRGRLQKATSGLTM